MKLNPSKVCVEMFYLLSSVLMRITLEELIAEEHTALCKILKKSAYKTRRKASRRKDQRIYASEGVMNDEMEPLA